MVDRETFAVDDSCIKSEAVFHEQNPELIGGLSAFNQIVGEIQDYIKHIAELKDDRLYALVADLLAENAIDGYLSELMPRYKQELAEKKEFTFSLKIAVAKELRLSPPKFFKGADVLRRVRNEFAHNLEIKTFEALKPELIDEIGGVLKGYFPKKQPTYTSIRDKFSSLMFHTVVALIFYRKHLRSLNSYLRDDVFQDNLLAYCRKHQGQSA
jgi:hypothetical protein